MVADHFIVARSDSHWKVSFHGSEHSPFETKEDAIAAAVQAAKEQSANGRAVEVLVQDIDSTFHSAWRSGGDDNSEETLAVRE
jgi:Uncharacterized protein conserved in bacteria (DUF2188)